MSLLVISLLWTKLAPAKSIACEVQIRGVQLGQRAAIYARVSTSDQSCERQVTELTPFSERGGYDVVGVFKDTAPGANVNSTARNRLLDLAQARQIDAILVSEFSRWGRSTQDIRQHVALLTAANGSKEPFSQTFHGRETSILANGPKSWIIGYRAETAPRAAF
ncbi:recombinase family protein [Sulfitobacter sp. 1A15299]|uniref:recombinase family protein n=1 Tax=Sulfitobacter sp. 1A15299 TaxID=3368598 RepID=UPI0037456417